MQTRRNLTNINPKNTNKSPIHEKLNAKITCDFGDDRCRIATARLEKEIFVKTHLHTSPIVVNIRNARSYRTRDLTRSSPNCRALYHAKHVISESANF